MDHGCDDVDRMHPCSSQLWIAVATLSLRALVKKVASALRVIVAMAILQSAPSAPSQRGATWTGHVIARAYTCFPTISHEST